MKKLLLLLTTFSLLTANSQVKQEFYVDDVETVEYLTVNFCVDSDGKTSEVTVLPEKTTYDNTDLIEHVVNYRKTIEYEADSKLNNNCYDYTFRFINSKYQNKIMTQSECEKCNIFKTGHFRYMDILYPDVNIIREKKIQTERSGNFETIFDIVWTSSCEYTLTYSKVSGKKYEYLLGKTIKVQIIDILKNGNYVYNSNLLDRTIVTGVMKKIK